MMGQSQGLSGQAPTLEQLKQMMSMRSGQAPLANINIPKPI